MLELLETCSLKGRESMEQHLPFTVKEMYERRHGKKVPAMYIPDYEQLTAFCQYLKHGGHTIVLTSGVWDLFHENHYDYLDKAAKCGDVLVVGVDTDELTKKRKGPNRPVVNFDARLKLIRGLFLVDLVAVRDIHHVEADNYSLIKAVHPDVLIMSESTADFTEEDRLNLQPHFGRIEVLPPQGVNTTSGNVRKLILEGTEELAKEIVEFIDRKLKGKNER